jgi:hypothetical protein
VSRQGFHPVPACQEPGLGGGCILDLPGEGPTGCEDRMALGQSKVLSFQIPERRKRASLGPQQSQPILQLLLDTSTWIASQARVLPGPPLHTHLAKVRK